MFEWNRIASPERNKNVAVVANCFLFTGKLYYELLALELCFEGGRGGRRVGDGRSDVLILGTAECGLWRTTGTDTRLSPVARERERNGSLASVVTHSEVMWRAHPHSHRRTTDGGHGGRRRTQRHWHWRHRKSAWSKANDRASVGDMGRWLWEERLLLELLLELRGEARHASSYRVLSELVVVKRRRERWREQRRRYIAVGHL